MGFIIFSASSRDIMNLINNNDYTYIYIYNKSILALE